MLVSEIETMIQDLDASSETITASLTFSLEFTGFQGHFPNFPVLPGVCMIQSLIAIIQKASRSGIQLEEVQVAKFFKTVEPGERINFRLREVPLDNKYYLVKGRVFSDEKRVAELKVRIKKDNTPT